MNALAKSGLVMLASPRLADGLSDSGIRQLAAAWACRVKADPTPARRVLDFEPLRVVATFHTGNGKVSNVIEFHFEDEAIYEGLHLLQTAMAGFRPLRVMNTQN